MNSPPTRYHYTPLVLACLAATWFVWGSTYLAIKFALVSLPPFFQMGTRFVAAGALLLVWMRWHGAPWPTRVQWRNAVVIGGLLMGGGMGGTAYAEVSISSGLVVAFIAVSPLLITAINMAYGDRPTRPQMAGMLLGLVGVLWLIQGQGFAGAPEGLVAIFIACLTWGLGSVWSQRGMPLAPGAMGFASEMLCGGVLLLAASWWVGEVPQWPPTPKAAWAWVYLVLAGSLVAFNAYMVLLAAVPTALASSYTFVNPVIAMLLGIALGGEVVTMHEWAAVGIILAGVVLIVLRRGARGG